MNYIPAGTAWSATPEFLKQHLSNPDLTWLISYPRTGSHWVRMLLELCLERPLLPRTFFHPKGDDPILYHEHDRTGDIPQKPRNVLYIYRNPVDTVFSLANYWMCFGIHKKDSEAARYTRDYMINLRKWLVDEQFTKKKTIIRYEDLKDDPHITFAKITAHFGISVSADKFENAWTSITKNTVSKHTQEMENSIFKNRVIAPEEDYEDRRTRFHMERSKAVWDTLKKDHELAKWFKELE